jgi:hypothetical protein
MARVFAVRIQIFLRFGAIAVQTISEAVIYHGAGFKLRADARFAQRSGAKLGVRVQRPLQICLECRSKSKNRDKQLTHIVRVRFSLQFILVPIGICLLLICLVLI